VKSKAERLGSIAIVMTAEAADSALEAQRMTNFEQVLGHFEMIAQLELNLRSAELTIVAIG
jgi:hypothetical protein